jgi:hypothetical protein
VAAASSADKKGLAEHGKGSKILQEIVQYLRRKTSDTWR